MTQDKPQTLFVDLDGCLVNSDLLFEAGLILLRKNPLMIFHFWFWLRKGRAHLKQQIADRVELDPGRLPYNKPFLEYLEQQKEQGRTLILASASNVRFVEKVAEYLGLFEQSVGSTADLNLKSENKLRRIRELAKDGVFAYAGDSRADIAIWKASQQAILVNCSPSTLAEMSQTNIDCLRFDRESSWLQEFIRAIRVHQWVKNLLLFVPLILSHQVTNGSALANALLAFVAFSLTASSVYLMNDMLDLEHDRDHPRKRQRPLASGSLDIRIASLAVPLLLCLAFMLASMLNLAFTAMLLAYFCLTSVYSFSLKKIVLVDVLVLASLYTWRILAGAAAIQVEATFWLLTFSLFLFLSLAVVKRFTELQALEERGGFATAGRGYRASDLSVLAVFGSSCGYLAVLIFALYINDDSTRELYNSPETLWLICPLLLYFVSRYWLLAHRGELDEDPVLFASRDKQSIGITLAIGLLITLAS